jgi:hypothetical protein
MSRNDSGAALVNSRKWWGETRVPMGTTTRWCLGPLSLWIHRRQGEWRIAHEEDNEAPPDRTLVAEADGEDDLWLHPDVERFALGSDQGDQIKLIPQLADRAVVAKPDRTLVIPPDTDMNVYVSSPLWASISASGRELTSFSMDTPFETWFGPSPREGELCYATRTACRLRWDDGLFRPHRALTAVHVQNRARQALPFDKIKIPVHLLALYVAPEGTLWSQDVLLAVDADGNRTPLQIRQGLPQTVSGLEVVSNAREQVSEHTLARTFGALLPR